MSRRARLQWTTAVVLLLFAGCFGGEGGECCGCQAARPPEPPTGPTATATLGSEPLAAATAALEPSEAAEPPRPVPDFSEPPWTRVASRAGQYVVCWRSITGVVPRNEDFELEAWVLRDGAPVRDAELSVNAWMPDHGHGMLRLPRTEGHGDGSFRVEGMLLHMRGLWQLRFDVLEGALSETAECALEL